MPSSEIRKELVKLISEMKSFPEFDESVPIIDSGLLDSFDLIVLVARISETFGVQFEGSDLVPETFANVGALAQVIAKRAKL
jgi:acyl carrier protein